MNNLKFEKKENAKVISLDDLSKTLTQEDINGRKSKIITHFDMIPKIQELLEQCGLKVGDTEIIVAKNGVTRLPKLDPNNEYVLDSVLVKQLVASFNIENFSNEEMNMRIGLSYNDRGVALAFGANVKVCSNMTIMGAKNMLYSYGKEKVPFDKMMELLEKNIQEMDQSWNYYNKIIGDLKGKIASPEQLYTLLGKLQKLAVANNYINGVNSAPLSITETSSFTRQLLEANAFESEVNTLWDIFNVGTNVLTHSDSNIATKWQSLAEFGNFIVSEADLAETPIIELSTAE